MTYFMNDLNLFFIYKIIQTLIMKVAFVHDWLVYPGGAENVFFDIIKEIAEDFSEDCLKIKDLLENNQRIKGNYKIPKNKINNYYLSKELLQKFAIKTPIQAEIFTTFYNPDFKLPVNLSVSSALS
jgi:hypothetical protein